MNYDDQFLYKLIKSLQSQMVYVLSLLSRAQQNNITISSLIQYGVGNPNDNSVAPVNAAIGSLYIETLSDGTPITIWTWIPGNTNWR